MKYNTKVAKNNFYDEYHQKNDNYFEIISKNNFTYFYIQKALSFVFSKKKPTKVLDIGCGVGTIGFYLTSLGSDVVGFDVSPRAIAIANNYKKISKIESITFFNKDVQKSKYSSDFELVICTEVIEHLEKDTEMLKTIHSSLSKGSYLLLSTPSINAPLFRMGMLKKFDDEVGHLRRYSPNELKKMIESAGFSVLKLYKVEGILRNSLFTLPIIGNLIRLIKGPLVPLFHFFDEISASIFGESDIIVVARKK